MKILSFSKFYYPHIGGVEKHIYNLSKKLLLKGHNITIVTENHDNGLRSKQNIDNTIILRFKFRKIKFLGLIHIWFILWKNRKLILGSDVIHCHDVFIWYLPFRFLFPWKKVYTTFHGWEGVYPVPFKNILLKKVANRFSNGTISIGEYIEKYYRIKSDIVTYGAVEGKKSITKKSRNKIVFVGRLEEDTGIKKLFSFLDNNKNYSVDFCGDGYLRGVCEKYGKVHGFTDPIPFYKKAEICFAGGYLSALEALSYKCKLMVGWNSPIKKDYWKLSPFLTNGAEYWAASQTWEKLSNQYLTLWNR